MMRIGLVICSALVAMVGLALPCAAFTPPPAPTYADAPQSAGDPSHANAPQSGDRRYQLLEITFGETSESGLCVVTELIGGSGVDEGQYDSWLYKIFKTPEERAQALELLKGSFLPNKPSDVPPIIITLLLGAIDVVKDTAKATETWPSSFAESLSMKELTSLDPDLAVFFAKKKLASIGVDYAASSLIDMVATRMQQKGLVGETGKEMINLWGNLAIDAARLDIGGTLIDASFAVYDSWQTTDGVLDDFQQAHINTLNMLATAGNAPDGRSWSQVYLESQLENSALSFDRSLDYRTKPWLMVADGLPETISQASQVVKGIGTWAGNLAQFTLSNPTGLGGVWYKAYTGI